MKNLRLAIRSLLHFRLYTVINILGLALALTCVIVIARYVHSETTVDRFHKKLDRIYVTIMERDGNSGFRYTGIDNPNNETTFVDMRPDPAVELSSTFYVMPDDEILSGEKKHTANVLVADTNFFNILDYRVAAGSNDLTAPDNVLLTESFARQLYGETDPLGQQFVYGSSGKTVTVTGIIEQPRTKSTLDFSVIIPESHVRMWGRMGQTLILLHPNQDYHAVNEKYDEFFEMTRWEYAIRYQLFPLKAVYLDKTIIDYVPFRHGNQTSIAVLTIVGLLILLVGVINFINIYTAVVLRRGREFGMKKVFGAPGYQIFFQLLAENMVLIGLALLIAMSLTEVLNPVVRNLLGFDQLPFRSFDLLLSLGLLLLLPLVTTLFPFLHYNYSAPVTSLRSVGKTGGRSVFRRGFLALQYVLTVGMIVVSLFFLKQLRFMLNADLGFRTEDIIRVPFTRSYNNVYDANTNAFESRERQQQLLMDIRQAVDESPLFTEWALGESPVGESGKYNFSFGDGEMKPVNRINADEKWLKVFGIELKEGRMFDSEIDNFYTYHLIAAESALPYFGITDIRTEKLQPERRLWWSSLREEEMKTNPPYAIVGVVKDFRPLHLGIQSLPIVIDFNDGYLDSPILASIAPGKRQEAIEFMRQLHDETVGGEFTYSFIEDDVKALYAEDRKVATIYSIFTVIAILISALGLFSMSLFDVQQRYKEIAIRKVNGATTSVIIGLLLKKYIVLLGISFVIAVPIAWYAIQRYLEGFAYKTTVSWWIFAAALLITAGISLLTLIHQTRKAALANPADVIRNE